MNSEIERQETTEDIAQRIIDTDNALQEEHEGGESNLVRAKRRETDFKELSKRMPGETDIEKEGQAAAYIEKLEQQESTDYEQAA